MKNHTLQLRLLDGMRIAAVLFLFAMLHAVGLAQQPALPSGGTGREISHKVKTFLQKADTTNRREIQAAQIAVQKATAPAVKEYAQSILDDQQQLAGDLRPLLTARTIKIDDISGDTAHTRKLMAKNGKDFDTAFVALMAEEQGDAVKLFENAAKNDEDPLVQNFAAQYVGKLGQHLAAAKTLKKAFD